MPPVEEEDPVNTTKLKPAKHYSRRFCTDSPPTYVVLVCFLHQTTCSVFEQKMGILHKDCIESALLGGVL